MCAEAVTYNGVDLVAAVVGSRRLEEETALTRQDLLHHLVTLEQAYKDAIELVRCRLLLRPPWSSQPTSVCCAVCVLGRPVAHDCNACFHVVGGRATGAGTEATPCVSSLELERDSWGAVLVLDRPHVWSSPKYQQTQQQQRKAQNKQLEHNN